jgi:dethiobiotin synthetase
MTAVFVTATGTDIGKTFVTIGLIRHFSSAGRAVEAIKPVVSGFDPAAWQNSDPAALLAALGRPTTLDEADRISPWRFAAPLSPHMAARHEGRSIAFPEVVDFCRRAFAARRGVLLIEGIGGIMVPLDERHTVLDWMIEIDLPAVLVAGSYVGTLSHTLTALDVLDRNELKVAAVVVSETPGSAASLADTADTIRRFATNIEVFALPRLPEAMLDHPVMAAIADLM